MALIKDFDFSANQTTMSFFPVEKRGNVTIVYNITKLSFTKFQTLSEKSST